MASPGFITELCLNGRLGEGGGSLFSRSLSPPNLGKFAKAVTKSEDLTGYVYPDLGA